MRIVVVSILLSLSALVPQTHPRLARLHRPRAFRPRSTNGGRACRRRAPSLGVVTKDGQVVRAGVGTGGPHGGSRAHARRPADGRLDRQDVLRGRRAAAHRGRPARSRRADLEVPRREAVVLAAAERERHHRPHADDAHERPRALRDESEVHGRPARATRTRRGRRKRSSSYLFDATPPFAAGQGWDYSDTNYIVLGMIMEGITGTKLYDEVQRRFLEAAEARRASRRRRAGGFRDWRPATRARAIRSGLPDEVMTNGVFVINPQFEWTGGGYATSAARSRALGPRALRRRRRFRRRCAT